MTSNDQPQAALPKPGRHWLKNFFLALLIFGCGFLAGGAFTIHAIHVRTVRNLASPEKMPERVSKHMKRWLRLSDEQTASVQKILEEHQRNLSNIFQAVRPQMEAEFEQTRKDVEAVLTPEQAKKWNARFKYFHDKWVPTMLRVPSAEPAQNTETK
jgi:Spy/CpxP family protein refolding chaperone